MEAPNLFANIPPEELPEMELCLQSSTHSFRAGSVICTFSGEPDKIGVLLSGKASLQAPDVEGRNSILEQYGPNDVFGELFSLPLPGSSYSVLAETPCTVLFLRHSNIIKRCSRACSRHSQLVDNLFRLTALKAQKQNSHLQLLSQRTTRERLLLYFELQSQQQKSRSLTLPMTFSSLADYLCIDRSAMTREIRRMNEDGLIQSEGRKIMLQSF